MYELDLYDSPNGGKVKYVLRIPVDKYNISTTAIPLATTTQPIPLSNFMDSVSPTFQECKRGMFNQQIGFLTTLGYKLTPNGFFPYNSFSDTVTNLYFKNRTDMWLVVRKVTFGSAPNYDYGLALYVTDTSGRTLGYWSQDRIQFWTISKNKTSFTFYYISGTAFYGKGVGTLDNTNTKLLNLILSGRWVDEPQFGYGPDITTPGGGEGNLDNESDPVEIPNLPTVSATQTGFISLYTPTATQLQDLANYMWSDAFDIDTFKKLFADPMDCILGLSILPTNIPDRGSRTLTVGNISTGVSLDIATSQYLSIECGTINVNEYWGAYLDYAPYTKCELYLPYIGIHEINTDDVMGKPVHITYHIDILTGACIAYVKCGESVIYSFTGQCSANIPITSSSWSSAINGAISIASSIGSMVATGGASAPMAVGNIASAAVNSMKPSIEKSGSLSGVGGMLGIQTPYLILTRPRQALPKDQNKYTGYPSYITAKLSDVSGYTEVAHVNLSGVNCTEVEETEIISLLKSGVII